VSPFPKPLILVDGRPLAYPMAGNTRYLLETLAYLLRPEAPYRYEIALNKPLHPDYRRNGFNPIVHPMPGLLWLNTRIPALARTLEADIFWGTLQLLPVVSMGHTRQVLTVHDLNSWLAPQTMGFMNRIQHQLLAPLSLKKADHIFCLSKSTSQDLLSLFPWMETKRQVVYPGITQKPATAQAIPLLQGKNWILTVGSLEPRKNHTFLIQAFLESQKIQNEETCLVIAGGLGWGKRSPLIQALLEGALEKHRVFYIKSPSDSELRWLYEGCQMFAFPSLYEGFGLPLLEALSYHRVCLASDIPVFREILDPSIDILLPHQLDLWIQAFHASREKKRDFPQENWSWKKTASLLEEGFLSLLSKG
jgi:glycosyltransferase involved in cell wall biosynthesis